jgi:hypothetical protein
MPGGEISIQTYIHPASAGLAFWLQVGPQHTLAVGLHTGLPVSVISIVARDALHTAHLLQPRRAVGVYRIADLSVDGQPLPNLEVRVSRTVSRLGLDGLIGLDFLLHFEHIHFHVPTLRLILSNPTNGASGQ